MSFDPRETLLKDIIENGERVERYLGDIDREAFALDSRTRDAVERCLERICEAAVRLGDDAPNLMPDQPWPQIRATGNWLRHAYHRVDPNLIWETAIRDIPALIDSARSAQARLST